MTFRIERADGSARVISGYKPSKPKLGTKRYRSARLGSTQLPPRVDLRPYMTQIEDQGETNSCVANAVAGAYEYLMKRYLGQSAYDVSRMFIYYNARTLEDDSRVEDEGSFICDAIEGLKQYGACSEESWPFDEESVNEEPDEDAYEEASQFLIEDTAIVTADLQDWKQVLAEGYPIIFGISLFNSFDKQRKPGLVPMPSDKESSRESHGGHAMLCVGYSDHDQVFIVRNSWGPKWGDKGYCYIPYRYLLDARFNDGDTWIIRRLEEIEPDQSTWGDDRSVLEDLSNALSEMSDEEYRKLLDAMGNIPLETRIALLFAAVAAVDELTDEELEEISSFLGEILESIGSSLSPDKVLRRASNYAEDETVIEESVALLKEHLSPSVLAGIVNRLQQVIEADEASKEEQELVNMLVQRWQVEAVLAASEEEDDEEYDEDEDEDDEEYDEDDEEYEEDEDDEEDDEDENDEE
jgi:hypothetical protein